MGLPELLYVLGRLLEGLAANVEAKDDELSFIAADGFNLQKSRILPSLALLKPHTPQQIQEMFSTH